jgi:hypothetical protein
MKNFTANQIYTLAFGLFLGLTIWKFGNPVILDHVITAPASASDLLNDSWPIRWATLILAPFVLVGGFLIIQKHFSWPANPWLWRLPMIWFGWQLFSAVETVDAHLTTQTLWQFSGCIAGYFIGALLFARENSLRWLLIGLLAAFTFCLVHAVDQKLFEYPLNHKLLLAGERDGWTNFPPDAVADMKNEHVIIITNGIEVANPAILDKMAKGRVSGTLVYPNALAGLIILLLPLSITLAFGATRKLKPAIRFAAIVMTVFLGSAAFFWTGSKLGWLIALGLAGLFLLRLDWPSKLKLTVIAFVLLVGLGIFAVRFHHYFAAGATSVGARFDYWRAALETSITYPLAGTGPGTFQRPYTHLKSPAAEMARLTHNDYLEQFSDSGALGGLAYAAWIFLALTKIGKKFWHSRDSISLAIFAGLLGWFAQGLGEFGLYVPALAWTAFTLLGYLIGQKINELDKNSRNN